MSVLPPTSFTLVSSFSRHLWVKQHLPRFLFINTALTEECFMFRSAKSTNVWTCWVAPAFLSGHQIKVSVQGFILKECSCVLIRLRSFILKVSHCVSPHSPWLCTGLLPVWWDSVTTSSFALLQSADSCNCRLLTRHLHTETYWPPSSPNTANDRAVR